MQCPEPQCNGYLTAVNTMPTKHLEGLNIKRRWRKCDTCHKRFATIEMLEDDFDRLKKPATLRALDTTMRK